MKLSNAQMRVLETAKKEIDEARTCETFDEYFDNYMVKSGSYNCCCNTAEKLKAFNPDSYEHKCHYWENLKNGIVLTMCNSKTLYRLQELNLIEIIKDSCGEHCGIDRVKILNY